MKDKKQQPTEQIKLRILLIDNDAGECATVDAQLEKDMRIPWSTVKYPDIASAKAQIAKADIIILKPEIEGLSEKEVFQVLREMVYETPIIVLANAGDRARGLSTYLMEQGAADMVVRGQFSRMVDAIEFAMIRQRISSASRQDAEDAIVANEVHSEQRLQTHGGRTLQRARQASADPAHVSGRIRGRQPLTDKVCFSPHMLYKGRHSRHKFDLLRLNGHSKTSLYPDTRQPRNRCKALHAHKVHHL